MKVLIYGNQDNYGIRFAEWFQHHGLEVTLCAPSNLDHARSQPEWRGHESDGPASVSIQEYSRSYLNNFLPPRQIRRKASSHDVVMPLGSEIVPGLNLDAPIVFNPTGNDLTDIPFRSGWLSHLIAFLYRRRAENLDRITIAQEDAYWAAKFLGVKDRVVRLPNPIDVDHIQAITDDEKVETYRDRYAGYDRVFLHLSRKNLDPTRPNYKGNEVFLEGFEAYLGSHSSDIRAVVGLHGHHVEEFKKELDGRGLEPYCDFVSHLPLPDLYALLSLDNAVHFDQFGPVARYSTSGLTRETMTLGTPVVTATRTESDAFVQAHGSDCPIRPAFEADDVEAAMRRFCKMSDTELERVGQRGHRWAREKLHWENLIEDYVDVLREAVDRHESNAR